VRPDAAARKRHEERITTVRGALHIGQLRAFVSLKRFIFVVAGTGGGKSMLGPRWMYNEIQRYQDEPVEKQEYLVFAPSYKILKTATLPRYLRFFHTLGLGEFKRADLVYILRNGARVYFRSCDNPESLEGIHARAAHGDEIGQDSVSLTVWETVQRRLGLYMGRFLGTTTPYNLGWLWKAVIRPWVDGKLDDVQVIRFPSFLNPAYPKEEFRRAARTMPPWKFRMFHLGEFHRPEGIIYDKFDEALHVIEPFAIPSHFLRFQGTDFGLDHPTAAIFGALDPRPYPNDVLYLYAEYRDRQKTTREHAREMLKRGGAVKKAFADPHAVQLIADYRGEGIKMEKGIAEFDAGVIAVSTRLAENRLKVFSTCLLWQDEVERYRWARDNDGNPTGKAIEFDDDLMDATRYLCMGLKDFRAGLMPSAPSADRERPIAAGILERQF
jgi:hypothetical protein